MVYGDVKSALNLDSDHGIRMNLVNDKFMIQGMYRHIYSPFSKIYVMITLYQKATHKANRFIP